MPAWLNRANLYIIAWCVYNTQGLLFPKGTIFTQLLIVLLLLVSLYYFFVANTRYKLPVYFYGLNLLLSMFVIYGVYLIIGGYDSTDYSRSVNSFSYLQTIMISLLPIYPFFVFFKERRLEKKSMYVWIILLIAIATLNYLKNQNAMLMAALIEGSRAEEFTNNVGYSFLSLLPACVLLYKKPLIQYVSFCYCMIFILMAMKRGAIIIGVVCLIWFLWKNLKESNPKMRIWVVFLSLLLCFTGHQFVKKQMEESAFFQKRIERTLEGSSSGRERLFSTFANHFWNETSPCQFIFGSGANTTLKVSDNYAHNDWLEIAVNQGVVGLLIYLIYWILWARIITSKKFVSHIQLALQLLFVIYFMKTFFSMSYGDMHVGATFILGYCLAQEKNDEQIDYCNKVNKE